MKFLTTERAWQIIKIHQTRVIKTQTDHGRRKRGFLSEERAAYAYVLGVVNYKTHCESCKQRVTRTELHHIDGNYLNNNPLNLIFLCVPCHSLAHRYLNRGIIMKKRNSASKIAKFIFDVNEKRRKDDVGITEACREIGSKYGYTTLSSATNCYHKHQGSKLFKEETGSPTNARSKTSTPSKVDVLHHIAVHRGLSTVLTLFE